MESSAARRRRGVRYLQKIILNVTSLLKDPSGFYTHEKCILHGFLPWSPPEWLQDSMGYARPDPPAGAGTGMF